MGFRYPNRFEISRLQALGDPPFVDEGEARRRYKAGRPVHVLPADVSPSGKPAWHLQCGPRFAATFYSASGTPLRAVTWERAGDHLILRSTKDLFYPDGDPGRPVPHAEITVVTREYSTDGVAMTTIEPAGEPGVRQRAAGVSLEGLKVPVPAFGQWDAVLEAGSPTSLQHVGATANDQAWELASQSLVGQSADSSGLRSSWEVDGWQLDKTGDEIVAELSQLVGTGATELMVLRRGPATIIPLAVQAGASSQRDPDEEVRRAGALANDLTVVLDHHQGSGLALGFDQNHWSDTVDAYVASLRRAGATHARFWGFGNVQTAVVLVWSGDKEARTRKLALHLVPSSWVSDRYDGKPERVDLRWDADSVQATKEKDA